LFGFKKHGLEQNSFVIRKEQKLVHDISDSSSVSQ